MQYAKTNKSGLCSEIDDGCSPFDLAANKEALVAVYRGDKSENDVDLTYTYLKGVAPEEFIPMAERAGLMQGLTDRVLVRALDFACRLESVGHYLSISVNISVVNLLDPEFPASVTKKLEKHRLEPHRLVLEVTETAAMKDPERALQALRSLHDAGIRLSIDDFGTGYSSLTYIRRLPLDEIKIDRSFVAEINRNTDDGIIVRATINMCHALGYQVVAEGVESAAALKELSILHCDYAQGYHVSRPMPETAALEWLQQKTAKNPA